MGASSTPAPPTLIVRAGMASCAIPIANVVETMRPLPTERLAGAPLPFVDVSIIRGRPTPVIALGRLLFDAAVGAVTRYVTVSDGDRQLALAVESVLGVRVIAPDLVGPLPSLLRRVDSRMVAAIGALDGALLLTLESIGIVPDEVWALLEPEAKA